MIGAKITLLCGLVLALGLSRAGCAPSGIAVDGSMGPLVPLTGPTYRSGSTYILPASLGTQKGGNLFQSFSEFNLAQGETADFTGTGAIAPIHNIIARVTGPDASSIDGTITSDIPMVNLFLINPSGILFGPDAHVSIPGAFTASTASYIGLADGVGRFNASLGGNDVLTSADVSEFGFLGTPANQPMISFTGTQLTLATGASFSVIGGDILLDGARVTAPGGNLSFFSAKGPGIVAYNPANASSAFTASTVTAFGNITLQNDSTVANGSTQGGGHIVIRGGALVVEGLTQGSKISSANTGANPGGSVDIQAGSVTFLDKSNLITSAAAAGSAGDITVEAQSLTINGSPTNAFFDRAGIGSVSEPGATGVAGSIDAKITGELDVEGSGEIASETYSSGKAGDVTIHALTLSLNGTSAPGMFTGITSTTYGGTGVGGDVNVTVDQSAKLMGGGEISADTFSDGAAGQVIFSAASLTMNGMGLAGFTGISSSSNGNATKNGGAINVMVSGDVSIRDGAAISTATQTQGNSGNITLTANNLTLAGNPALSAGTGIFSSAAAGSTGQGGDIMITATGKTTITDTAVISADTDSNQQGGSINFSTVSLTIDGSAAPKAFTGITASTGLPPTKRPIGDPAPNSGPGGNLVVTVDDHMSCTGGGGIEEETFGLGKAGTLNVNVTGDISLTNGGFISGDAFDRGSGGSVTVSANTIYIDAAGPLGIGAKMKTLTGIASDANDDYGSDFTGNGGTVSVTCNSLSVVNGGKVSASTETEGNGGDVTVTDAGSIRLSKGGQISASSSRKADANASGGTSGTVQISAPEIALNYGSTISTSAASADAGLIDVTHCQDFSLFNGSSITTSAGLSGGSIDLAIAGILDLQDATIKSEANGGRNSKGGDINIDPLFVILSDSRISANDKDGHGGNITILTDNFLKETTLITATGTTNGTITISSPNLDLGGRLVGLPNAPVDDGQKLRETCATSIRHEFSSLIVVGRNGIDQAPDELQPDFGVR